MLEKYKDYKNVKMPEDMKNNILNNVREGIEMRSSKPSVALRRRVLIYAAVFACLVMVVSAVVYNNNRAQYIPGVGFVYGDFAIYALPEVIDMYSVTIEGVMRTCGAETGRSDLTIILNDAMPCMLGYRTLPDGTEWFVNMRQLWRLQEITATMPDGQEHIISRCEDFGAGMGPLVFFCENFPAVNEFTLSADDPDAGEVSAQVVLERGAADKFYGYAKQNGAAIVMRHLAKNSRILVFQIFDETLSADYLFPEGHNFEENLFFLGEIRAYDESGNYFYRFMGGALRGHAGDEQFLYFLEARPEGRIAKFTSAGFFHAMDERWWSGYETPPVNRIYMDIDIPVPADGEIIEFDEPLVIFDRNGMRIMLDSIERDGDSLTVTNYEPNLVYETANGGAINFSVGFGNSSFSSVYESGRWRHTIPISSEDIASQSVRLHLRSIRFMVYDNWEINFGE